MIWYTIPIEQNILKLVTLDHFLLFYPPKKTPKSKFWKMKKYHHFTRVPKITIYDVRFLRYGVRQTEFFVIMGHLLPFYHPHLHLPNDPENQNFEKKNLTNAWIYYPFIHTWNVRCDRQSFSSFWAIFFLSAPWQPRKSKF